MAKIPFALQLYSVRDVLETDRLATLRRVKEIGYDHVELAGTPGGTVEEFKADLDAVGLEVLSCHVEFAACTADLAGVIRDCQTLGVSWAVIPWLCGEENTSIADWTERGREMAAFGRAFQEAGIRLCYHNHHHEFVEMAGKTAFDVVFETAPAADLGIELDVGWSHYGGADTLALMRRYAGRIPLLHIKDVKQRYEGEEPVVTELGNGATKFPAIFKAATEIGVEWLIVEQDESARDSLESARMNAAFMRVHLF
ncbi:MAG: sugar phosphate isomerase/epimerase [Candidatus Hydrogenedentes bacterium]|nr:sugar phosphate isomerase/epimerase [Candidatus Hydrogenedentota bacterium]